MHRKTQLFATHAALPALADMPALTRRFPEVIRMVAAGTSDPSSLREADSPLGPSGPTRCW